MGFRLSKFIRPVLYTLPFVIAAVTAIDTSFAATVGGTPGGGAGVSPVTSPGTEGSLGSVIMNTIFSVEYVPGLFAGLAYLFGLVLGVLGIMKLYEHVQDPRSNPPWEFMKKFLAGGAMLALPSIMSAARNTLSGEGGSGDELDSLELTGFNVKGLSGGGLDAMVVALMADTAEPINFLISAFGYIAGTILTIIGITRLLKTAQEGPRGPGGIGTIMTFITAGAMFSLSKMLGAWSTSLFGDSQVATYATLAFDTGMGAAELNHVHSVISAVLMFMIVLGWISFVRGWFILRDVAEGSNQASMMAGLTHLFGGALAVNLGPVLNAVQVTFGLTDYGVNFG